MPTKEGLAIQCSSMDSFIRLVTQRCPLDPIFLSTAVAPDQQGYNKKQPQIPHYLTVVFSAMVPFGASATPVPLYWAKQLPIGSAPHGSITPELKAAADEQLKPILTIERWLRQVKQMDVSTGFIESSVDPLHYGRIDVDVERMELMLPPLQTTQQPVTTKQQPPDNQEEVLKNAQKQ